MGGGEDCLMIGTDCGHSDASSGIATDITPEACWVYGSDILHGDRLYGAVDVFLKRDDISEESKRKLLVDNTARFYGLSK